MNDEMKSIILAASELNVDLKKPNPRCKSCYGRGWTGKKTSGEPIPCQCIFRKEIYQRDIGVPMRARNRAERREQLKKKK